MLNSVPFSLHSIGLALTDTLDDLISDERINPQLAMKILGNFDQAITEALQKNVKNRLSFKVITALSRAFTQRRENMVGLTFVRST